MSTQNQPNMIWVSAHNLSRIIRTYENKIKTQDKDFYELRRLGYLVVGETKHKQKLTFFEKWGTFLGIGGGGAWTVPAEAAVEKLCLKLSLNLTFLYRQHCFMNFNATLVAIFSLSFLPRKITQKWDEKSLEIKDWFFSTKEEVSERDSHRAAYSIIRVLSRLLFCKLFKILIV